MNRYEDVVADAPPTTDGSIKHAGESIARVNVATKVRTGAAIAPIALLAACGGASAGDTGTTPIPTTVGTTGVIVTSAPPTDAEASRFLVQATMGATRTSIAEVVSKGYEGWIDAQFKMNRRSTLWDTMVARGENAPGNVNNATGYDDVVWRSLITEPDQLRQRVATGLLDFLVLSMTGNLTLWPQFACAGYLDILMDGAFGNYRTLLEQVTLNPGMSSFLSTLSSRKFDSVTGAEPDENYAREVMQLFSIGLNQLNMDGSIKTNNGTPIDSYSQADVSQLARVFTGLSTPDFDWKKITFARTPLVFDQYFNESGASTFLGKTVSGGGMTALRAALDHLFSNSNVPPFVSKQLIQRLVTSNPSPAYIQRVATVFADNGKGVRGDLQAVVRAILLDTEARSDASLVSTTAGRLRPPVQRFTAWARALNVSSASDAWKIGNLASGATGIGQSTGQAPSVFNFFRPGYTPPGSEIQTRGLVAPELQMENEQSTIGYVNFMYRAVGEGIGDVKADYSALTSIANDSGALVAEVNLLLAAGQLSAGTIATIKSAADSANGAAAKINIVVLLTLSAPEFLVTR